MNMFYKQVSKRKVLNLQEEKEYYLENADAAKQAGHEESEEAYRLMADFYDALIVTANKHIQENMR